MRRLILAFLAAVFFISPASAACVLNAVGPLSEAASGNLTLNAPASPQTNDIWLAIVNAGDNSQSLTDWTVIRQNAPNHSYNLWYHRYSGSTPNLTITNAGVESLVGGIIQLRGCKTSGSPVDTLGSVTDANNTDTAAFASITPSTSNTLLLAIWGYNDNLTVSAGPSGFTEGFSYQTALGNDGGVYIWHKAHASGATGGFTATMNAQGSDDEVSAYLVAIGAATEKRRRSSAKSFQ